LPPGRWADDPALERSAVCALAGSGLAIAPLLPEGLQVDTFQGSAWLGVVPFWMDRIKVRGVPPIPGARSFPDLNLRTYVRDPADGNAGVYILLAGCQQPAGGGGGARLLSSALPLGRDAAGAAVGAGVRVL
jgi:uncharacterized protein